MCSCFLGHIPVDVIACGMCTKEEPKWELQISVEKQILNEDWNENSSVKGN